MTHNTTQDTTAAGPARTTEAASRPRAARWPDGTFTSPPPRPGAPPGEAQ